MSWNLLAYAVPFFMCRKFFLNLNPATYLEYEEASASSHSALVKEVAERALNAEIQSRGDYQERIQDMRMSHF